LDVTGDSGWTNFAQYSHQQLYAMLYAGNPSTARTAAGTWDDTGNSLHSQANRLEGQLNGFSDNWQGGAADQYKTMMTDLIGGIRKVADTAYSMRNLAYEAADAQDTARAQMPAPVDVPTVPPATVALASAPIQVDANTPAAVVAQIQQARSAAISAVQGQQQASAAADAAHAKAVLVMQTLAGNYVTAKDSIPPAPDAATAPATPTAGSGGGQQTAVPTIAPIAGTTNLTDLPWTQSGNLTDPIGTPTGTNPTSGLTLTGTGQPQQPESPLFGDMFTAGVAAASAAVFGRFGSLIPKVPSFVGKNKDGSTAGGTNPDGTPKLGDRTAGAGGLGAGGGAAGAKLAGAGGAGLKGLGGVGGGLGGAGGVAAAGPSASPSMLGSAASSDLAAGVGGAVGAAAAKSAGMPMMPMMPMGAGMGGGGDMGGGRRIPPWLVETEDVWGESSSVAPTVIGEEPDLGGSAWG
jgi:uncharacterized protein YukE